MKTRLFLLAAALVLPAVVGCSSSDPGALKKRSTGTGSDEGTGTDTGNGGNTDNGTPIGAGPGESTPVDGPDLPPPEGCNNTENIGTDVKSTKVSDTIPTGTGGQFLDGEYLLTAVTHYSNTGSVDTYKGLVRKQSGGHQYVMAKNGSEKRTTMRAEIVGANMTLTGRCGTTETKNLTYTAITETEFVVYDAAANTSLRYKRPLDAQ